MTPLSLTEIAPTGWAFDFDGVLAVKPPPSPTKWGKMGGADRARFRANTIQHYRTAPALAFPDVQVSHVISARKDTPEIRAVSEDWLKSHLGYAPQVFLLSEARTIPNVGAFKARVLKQLGATNFIEDNLKVLAAIRSHRPACALWFWEAGMSEPTLFFHP